MQRVGQPGDKTMTPVEIVVLCFLGLGAVFVIARGFQPGAYSISMIYGIAVIAYFAPALIGRDKRTAKTILLVNFVIGWTLVGWLVALVWASRKDAADKRKRWSE